MLVNFTVQNYTSFRDAQSLRMEAVSSKRDDFLPQNVHEITNDNDRILKSALLFGANASGKSNLIRALSVFRQIVLRSRLILEEGKSPLGAVHPFLLDDMTMQEPTVFEVVFYQENIKYRYGIEVGSGVVTEEWLYYVPESRETLLFERIGQKIEELNEHSFSEARRYMDGDKLKGVSERVPLVSMLVDESEHAKSLVDWFNCLRIISDTEEQGFLGYTLSLLGGDKKFQAWVKDVLSHFQIADLELVEVETKGQGFQVEITENGKSRFLPETETKTFELRVVKEIVHETGTKRVVFPIGFESEGTRKLIHILGPLYDAVHAKRILVIDEIEAKFHSNLTKFLFRVFHQENQVGSQIIAAAHDTSLMDTKYFRRDQINFVNKNEQGASELYSLSEFKEKARKIKEHYGAEYLSGAFGAIMLFETADQLEQAM